MQQKPCRLLRNAKLSVQFYGTDPLDVRCIEVDTDSPFSILQVRPFHDSTYPHGEHRLVGTLTATVRLARVFDVALHVKRATVRAARSFGTA